MLSPETLERIERKLIPEPNSGCWFWLAATSNGFGVINVGGSLCLVHVLLWEARHGARHGRLRRKCRTPPCCNPDHFEPRSTRRAQIALAYASGMTLARAADMFGVTIATAHRAIHDAGVHVHPRRKGPDHPLWRGRTYKGRDGYQISHDGRVHRLVASRLLGRALKHWEHAHHVDENRLNNDDNNIAVMTAREHNRFHTFLRHRGATASRTLLTLYCRTESNHYWRFTKADLERAQKMWPCPEKDAPRKQCRVRGCDDKIYGRGRCSKHYQRWRAKTLGYWRRKR